MPMARKRSLREIDPDDVEPLAPPSMLHRIRNMWQFANIFQFIFLFGKALKIEDNLEIEDLEAECLKPGARALQDIGLALLKFMSSHRGLTHELFDEYTRRQFLAKAPEKNPFGTDEAPSRFADFDVFTKIRVLHQMTQIIMMNPERLREKSEEQKDVDQTNWRIEPYGWDSDDRTYFVLDDNRIYRLTEPPPPPPRPKKNTQKAKAAQRSSKRRRIFAALSSDAEDAGDEASEHDALPEADDGLGGMKWECIAVTLDEVRQFLSHIQKSKDSNEKVLRSQILDHLVPILEKQEESRKRKQIQREREMLNLEKLAHAKRSSRIAGRLEQQKILEQSREEERKRHDEEIARRKEDARREKMERERDKRLMSREQRLREREVRRLQHEEELAQLSEDSKSTSTGPGRMSERRRLVEIERAKQALKEIDAEEDDWIFDCVCGFYGQVDDGTHSVACERCNVWQHSKCLGIGEEEAEKDDFHFVCAPCRKHEQSVKAQRPRIIKIKVSKPDSSPSSQHHGGSSPAAQRSGQPQPPSNPPSSPLQSTGATGQTPDSSKKEGLAESAEDRSSSEGQVRGVIKPVSTGQSPDGLQNHAFSSPHPTLSPPMSFDKSKMHSSVFDGSGPGPLEPVGGGIRISTGDASDLSGTGNGISPLKHPQRPPSPPWTKETISIKTAEAGSSLPAILPQFTPGQSHSNPETRHNDSPLLPSHSGLSPTKQSPPAHQRQVNCNSGNMATPGGNHSAAVFPPATALSPSPHQQILTPPVKSVESARAPPLEKSAAKPEA